MKNEIGNRMPCLEEEMQRRVCEAWYSVRPNILEELNHSIPSRNENVIKAKGGATNSDFIGSMHTAILLCFH